MVSKQDKEFLLVLEELQNAYISNSIDSTTRYPTAGTRQGKKVPLESLENVNTSFAYPRYGVTSEGPSKRKVFLFRHSLQLKWESFD